MPGSGCRWGPFSGWCRWCVAGSDARFISGLVPVLEGCLKCAVWLFPHVRWSDGGAGVGLGCRFRRDQRCGEPAFFLRVGKLPGLSSCSSGGARVPEGRIFRPVGVLSSCDNLAGLDCSLARQLPVLLRTRCPPLVGVSSRACPVAPQALGQNSDSNSNYGIFEVFMKQPSSTLTGELKAPPLDAAPCNKIPQACSAA